MCPKFEKGLQLISIRITLAPFTSLLLIGLWFYSTLYVPTKQTIPVHPELPSKYQVQRGRHVSDDAQLPKLPAIHNDKWIGRVENILTAFKPILTSRERRVSYHLLQVFSQVMFANRLDDRWMLSCGSLLGSYRHHGMIPWDDEIDVMVDVTVREVMGRHLKMLQPDYQFTELNGRGKFFPKFLSEANSSNDWLYSTKFPSYPHGWPFLDIEYYFVNSTKVNNPTSKIILPIFSVFPLYFRPFGPIWAPAPRNTLHFLKVRYRFRMKCKSLTYSHKKETAEMESVIPCSKLTSAYPFVQRRIIDEVSGTIPPMVLVEEKLVSQEQNANVSKVLQSVQLFMDANIEPGSF